MPAADSLGQFGLLFQEPAAAEPAPAPAAERKVWSVAELVGILRGRLERDYADELVQGEISNCRAASSGHLYFTLKDGDAQLPVVLFRRAASLLRFKPEDGLAVMVRGRISVFESRGQLQMIAESVDPRGAGAMQVAVELLKAKLRAEGLFDADRKRPLPAFPRTLGVITSTQGAVIRDIVTVCRRRNGCLNILVYPATMQGTSCAAGVAAGLNYFNNNALHRVDVIVIARGGGSAEDLWGFNDESLARAIAASQLPVVSAIGHETDFTLADFVADLRAPTPSAAAELVTAAQHRVEERVQALAARLLRGIRFAAMQARQRYTQLASGASLARMRDSIGRRAQRVDERRYRLEQAANALLQQHTTRLQLLTERLQRQHLHRSVMQAQTVRLQLDARLQRVGHRMLQPAMQRSARADARLQSLSPTAVLQRGYALVFNAQGKLLRSADQVVAGDEIVAQLASGRVRSRVTPNDSKQGNNA